LKSFFIFYVHLFVLSWDLAKWYEFYEEKVKEIGVFDKWTRSRFLRTIHDVIVFEPKPLED